MHQEVGCEASAACNPNNGLAALKVLEHISIVNGRLLPSFSCEYVVVSLLLLAGHIKHHNFLKASSRLPAIVIVGVTALSQFFEESITWDESEVS